MLSLDVVNDFMYEHFSKVTTSKNGSHFHARCILCGDSKTNPNKKRFHLEYNSGQSVYHCFNCNASGSFLELYSILKNISINEAKKELYQYNPENLIQILSTRKKEKFIKEIEHEVFNYILDDCVGLDYNNGGYIQMQYKSKLKQFKNDRKIPDNFKLFIAYRGEYQGRVLLPIYDGNDIVYFQGRLLENDDDSVKYKNPTLQKESIILNKGKFDRNKYIVITEGIIDALQIGDQGTSCLGATISNEFIEELLTFTDMGVIIALDNDERGKKEMVKFIKTNKYASNVRYFLFPNKYNCKDFGELVNKYSVDSLYEMIIENSLSNFEALMKLKMEDSDNEINTKRNGLYRNK